MQTVEAKREASLVEDLSIGC